MKKLLTLISILFMSMFCLTGCNEIHKGELETIEITSYVKEEEVSKLEGAMIFYCIFGSYTSAKTEKPVQRYIFLAQNGPRESYKINDVHVGDGLQTDDGYTNHVYFKYIEERETPYLEYQKVEPPGKEYNYWLYLPKSKVLEIANNMFKDI